MTHFVSNRGACTLSLIKFLVGLKYPRLVKVLDACRNLSAHEYLENAGRIHELRGEWVKYWRAQKLDFVIFPGFATEAPNHGSSNDGSLLASYTFVLNLLGMVSCAQPITVTKETELTYESDWEDPVTELIRNNLKDAQGLPVGIQVVGLPFSEERVLGLSKRIEGHFKFYKNNPLPNVWRFYTSLLWDLKHIYPQISKASFLFSLDLPLLGFFGSTFVFHLFESYLFYLESQLFEKFCEDVLEVFDGVDIWFIEVDPDFDTVAGGIVDFWGDKSKAINFFAAFEVFSHEEES